MTSLPLEDKDFHEAMERLSRTRDGRTLYLFLQRRMMAVATSSKSGALRVDQGERMFAAKLIGLMAKGIADSGGRIDSSSTGGTSDQPIVFAVSGPRRITDAGTRRRVTADTRVAGWDRDPEPEAG